MATVDELEKDKLPAKLAAQVGASKAGAHGDEYMSDCTEEALELVRKHLGAVTTVPLPLIRRAVIECAADLYWRRQARNGVATFETEGAIETVRVGLDPMRSARAVLDPYLGPAIA